MSNVLLTVPEPATDTAPAPRCPRCGTPLYPVPGPRSLPTLYVCPNAACGNVEGYTVAADGALVVATDIPY